MAAALSDLYAEQTAGNALLGRRQGVFDLVGGKAKGVGLNSESGIQCAVIFLPACIAKGVRKDRRGGQGEAQNLYTGGVVPAGDRGDLEASGASV